MGKFAQWALVAAAWFAALSVAATGVLALDKLARIQAALSAPKADPVDPYALRADGTALCPVTGQRVVVGPQTPKVVYLGRTYFFSTDKDANGVDARTRFLTDPEACFRHGAPGSAAPAPGHP
jgi:hypothetical protein